MKTRSWKIVGIIAGILLVIAITLAVALPILIDPNRYHDAIVSEIQRAVGGDIRLGRMTWGISNGVWLEADGLAISNAHAFPGSATLSRVYVKASIQPLLSRKFVLTDLILEGPKASVMLAPGNRRASSVAKSGQPGQVPTPSPSDSSPELELEIRSVSITLDRVELVDAMTLPEQEVKRVFRDVMFTADNLVPGGKVDFRTSFQDSNPRGLGQLTASGSFTGLSDSFTVQNPELQCKTDVTSLHVEALNAYFPNHPVARGLAGAISMTATYDGNLTDRHQMGGRIDLAQFSYTDPTRWTEPITGADTAITFSVAVDPKKLSMEKLTIQRGANSASASGVLEPWYRNPVLRDTRISGDLASLPEVVPLIPWEQMGPGADSFRKAMERGGKITIQQAVIADIDLAKPPASAGEWLSKIDAIATAAGVSVQPTSDLPVFEDITTGIALKDGTAVFTGSRLRIGPKIELTGKGSIRDLGGKQPVLQTAEFGTAFPLSALIQAMPWKRLGDNAAMVRQVLEGGGSVVIDRAVFRDVDLSDPPDTFKAFLPRIELAAKVSGLSLQPSKTIPQIEGLTGIIGLRNSTLTVTNAKGRIGPVSLPEMNISVTDVVEKPKLTVVAKGPMDIAATRQASVEKLLKNYGLKILSGSADLDLTVNLDLGNPKKWRVTGNLSLGGVRAETYPASVVMEDLRGNVFISRKQFTTISVKDISARVNREPVRLSGTFSRLGAPDPVIDAKAYTQNLDLGNMRELIPALKKTDLSGKVTMDLDVTIPYGDPTKSRLSGTLTARQMNLKAGDTTIQEADADLLMAGNTATVKRLTGKLNDQPLSITGKIVNPAAPDIQLAVTSPNLNLDRLVPTATAAEPSETSGKTGKPAEKKADLPPIAKKTVAQVTVTAEKGKYRGLAFQNLTLEAVYDRGVVKTFDLKFGSGQGRVALVGSADVRRPDQIPFSVTPDVSAIPVEQLADVIGLPESSVTGPVFLKGQLSGRTGTRKELLASLEGNLDAQMGPGSFSKIGPSGKLMASILSLTSVQGILSGALFRDFDKKGMDYKRITTQTAFSKGIMDVKSLALRGDALNVDGQGRIDMVNDRLNLGMNLGTLGLIGGILKAIPLFGKPVDNLTEIHVDIKGPIEKPNIQMQLLK